MATKKLPAADAAVGARLGARLARRAAGADLARQAPAVEAPRRGRKPLAPELRTVPGTLRMRPDQWEKFAALGGNEWLRKRVDLAKAPA